MAVSEETLKACFDKLTNHIDSSNDILRAEIGQIKSDLVNVTELLKSDVSRINTEVSDLKNRLSDLEANYDGLLRKFDKLENQQRSKNIILFGVREENDDDKQIENTSRQLNITSGNIERAFRIGKKQATGCRPLIFQLDSTETKEICLKNAGKLPSGIYAKPDLTLLEREKKRARFLEKLSDFMIAKGNVAVVQGNTILLNGIELSKDLFENWARDFKSNEPTRNNYKGKDPASTSQSSAQRTPSVRRSNIGVFDVFHHESKKIGEGARKSTRATGKSSTNQGKQ